MTDAYKTAIAAINTEFGADLAMYTGQAPVQVWGSVGDVFAYFRYRGAYWSLEIAASEDVFFNDDKIIYEDGGKFGERHQGWLDPDDLKRLLHDALSAYHKGVQDDD